MTASFRKAFSLVELLVVIGIIGILAGIMLTSFSGGTESARAAKCLNNMRSLAMGVINEASRNKWGYMPSAGTWVEMDNSDEKKTYVEHVGWISWLSMNGEYGGNGRPRPNNFVAVPNAGAYCEDDKKAIFAVTNGALWQAVGRSSDVYKCPCHQIQTVKKGAKLRWSYVMNAYFGYDWSDGSKAIYTEIEGMTLPIKPITSKSVRPDRRLLFAELPIYGTGDLIDEGGKSANASYPSEGGTATDCVLQYKGYEFNKKWSGAAESIAFNHKAGKNGWCAHVVFADGHTEKLLKPKESGGGVNAEQLTALLCAGKDIGVKGSVYTWVNTTDKSE